MYHIIDTKGDVIATEDDYYVAELLVEALEIAKQERHVLIEAGEPTDFYEGPRDPTEI